MPVLTLPVGPLGCNCSVIADEHSKRAIVVDPGGDFPRIREILESEALSVVAVIHTHTHIDHVGATAPLCEHSGAAARIHEADRFLYDLLPIQAQMLGMPLPPVCDMEGTLEDGTTLHAGSIELGVIHTPGHTPGSVSFLARIAGEKVLFSGDTLFKRGIGRTDLWGGDANQIRTSLRNRLLTLDDDVVVVPGHGPATSIGEERRLNPFLAES